MNKSEIERQSKQNISNRTLSLPFICNLIVAKVKLKHFGLVVTNRIVAPRRPRPVAYRLAYLGTITIVRATLHKTRAGRENSFRRAAHYARLNRKLDTDAHSTV